MVRTGSIPPTLNYRHPDPACGLDDVPQAARRAPGLDAVLCNSFGFGGHDSSILLTGQP
jgi:3-oxoacyl-[acyl-carrier-protein] synthase II